MSKEAFSLSFFDKPLAADIPCTNTLYRFSRQAYLLNNNELAKKYQRLIRILHNSEVPCKCDIGDGTSFAYGGISVLIHKSATIGGTRSGAPRVGDDVFVATGARLIGGITVGNGTIIGANAVLTKDTRPFSIWAGVPAIRIGQITSANLIRYANHYSCRGNKELVDAFRKANEKYFQAEA